jgi:hypothetical protein
MPTPVHINTTLITVLMAYDPFHFVANIDDRPMAKQVLRER